MHSGNKWGGPLEVAVDQEAETRSGSDLDRAALYHRQMQASHELDETQQGWLLDPREEANRRKKKKYVDLGCVVCSQTALKWSFIAVGVLFVVVGLPIIIAGTIPKPNPRPPPSDVCALALKKALLFFNAQKSGKLPKNNGIFWRGDSGLTDGKETDFKEGLVGGYYDGGVNVKFHFPMAYAMTMLSWSFIEYNHKFKATDEYDYVRDLIKWGTDYLLLTFNSNATTIDNIYFQVGSGVNGTTPNDAYCWERPEDIDYKRTSFSLTSGSDLAAEMAAALAAASIVFRDDRAYSKKLLEGATALWTFSRDKGKRKRYSENSEVVAPFYNSTGYYDEYIWGATWLYYASGNISYLKKATSSGFAEHSKVLTRHTDLMVPSWDNKLPTATLLLTRCRIFLGPGYPYEEILRKYHDTTSLNMCAFLHRFQVFNWTKGGMIQLNHGKPKPLQYVATAAFLASLYVDYMNANDIPGFYCGSTLISPDVLRNFSTSQVDYILGKNPQNMSYVVGHGTKYPRHVHHRGASIPHNGKRYSCTGGWKWRDSLGPNPNNITGGMVGGPNRFDQFHDVRASPNYTEPTLAGNAGLVAALVSLTNMGGNGIDKNFIFSAVPPLYPPSPPPPSLWKP